MRYTRWFTGIMALTLAAILFLAGAAAETQGLPDEDVLLLRWIWFDTSPVNAEEYNRSTVAHAYADETLMPKLFRAFFPEYTYADGRPGSGTLQFIGRKPDGTQVLLCGVCREGSGWEWTESTPLPGKAEFGCENFTDSLCLRSENSETVADVTVQENGIWSIYDVNFLDFYVGPEWVGRYPAAEEVFFGTHGWGDITKIDWSSLPLNEYLTETDEEKAARLGGYVDRTDWATPAQENPEAMTELRAEAGNEAPLLGLFLNGAPLHVLERGTEWTKVRIGQGEGTGTMTGWMRTAELSFGDDILKVDRDAMRRAGELELSHPVVELTGARKAQMTTMAGWLVIGETEMDEPYMIVYDLNDGDVGMVRTEDLNEGNG